MKNLTQLSSAIPVLAALLAPCAPALEHESSTMLPVATAAAGHGRLAGNIHAQVNAYRQSLGKPGLKRLAGLDRLTQQHSEFMRRNRGGIRQGE